MIVPHYYEDPHILHENTMPNRAYFIPASRRRDDLVEHRENSDRFQLLNGDWRFRYYHSIYDLQEPFYQPGYDLTDYDTTPVPGVWQNHGYDHHQYTNIRYPFPADPPYVPKDNPCGAYICDFVYHQDEIAPCSFLNFEGVASCFYVWLNGNYVGYSQVSHSTSEFDVTRLLHNGSNHLAVLVLKWCDGSYMEDQDMFRMNGIFRDVYLLRRPEQRIEDYFITTVLSHGNAEINVRLRYADLPTATRISVYSAEGELVGTVLPEGNSSDTAYPYQAVIAVKDPILWNAEQPYLYTIVLETSCETITDRVGLREVRIADNQVLVNGLPIKFHGINRHESDPVTGYTIGLVQTKRDLEMIKRNNFNAIRTSHYPDVPYFYQLCDQYGFFVIDEADNESHGASELYCSENERWDMHVEHWNEPISDNPEFTEATVDRTRRCVERDKNRPCVIIWSMGNESAYGCTFEEALAWTKQFDPSRLTHYESAQYRSKKRKYDFSNIDLYSNMYPSLESVQEYLDNTPDKPYLMCEYCHCMGNGPGDLEDYFQMIQSHSGLVGGFLWEWCDHGIYKGKAQDGRSIFYYGGDHGEWPHDGNFCMDGLVFPDRRPHTGLLEFKNVYRPARVVSYDQSSGALTLHNYMDFTELTEYVALRYEVSCDGEILISGNVNYPDGFRLDPHTDSTLPLRVNIPEKGRCFLKIFYHCKQDSEILKEGYLLGFDELPLENRCCRNQNAEKLWELSASAGELHVRETDRALILSCEQFTYVFSKLTGLFDKMTFGNETLLERPMGFNVWRAPTDNDRKLKLDWYAAHYDHAVTNAYSTSYEIIPTGIVIRCRTAIASMCVQRFLSLDMEWVVLNNGAVTLSLHAARNTVFPELPRFGLRLFLPAEMSKVSYYGMGPMESYCDKHRASSHGSYAATIWQMHEDYIRPQENGSHFDCDYVIVQGDSIKLTAVGKVPFCFNASPYTQEELTQKAHNYELNPCGCTVLCLDYAQNGIGSESCGPRLLEKYRLNDADFDFSLRLIPSLPTKE
ncbi:MAG: glycoside hydrolase family 2 TIM barrel-domain containing protein [Oscillospiraceae bacterium]|nr:glycoside hydrolase family 2 TIM barrel-domain containing protein [Oscillospiraceae bacterium]